MMMTCRNSKIREFVRSLSGRLLAVRVVYVRDVYTSTSEISN
jgi:hypothetical protein